MRPLSLTAIMLSASILSACGGSSVVSTPSGSNEVPSSIATSSIAASVAKSSAVKSSIIKSSIASSELVASSVATEPEPVSSAIAVSSRVSSSRRSVTSSAPTVSSISSSVKAVSSKSNSSVPSVNADVRTAAGSPDSRLACYKGAGEEACNLRTYQMMVEAFVDGDGNVNMNTGYGTSHHKGDLQGVINSLDYIKSLGMNSIWITPVFDSTTGGTVSKLDATGYFASNYFDVDPHFGSKQKLKELVDTAHAKGLYVLLDGVFGHSKGNVGNFPSPTNKVMTGRVDQIVYPTNLEFFKEVATYWVTNYKIDGWRLDQAYQVPVQHWKDIREAVATASASVTYANEAGEMVQPLGYMVGEIWKGEAEIKATGYGSGESSGLLSAYDFPMRYRLVQTLAVEESGVGKSPATALRDGFKTQAGYPDYAMPNLMLTNHDLVRFGDLIQRGNIANPSDEQYWSRHKAAMAFMAAYSGPITLYYGDEIGQEVANFAAKVGGACDNAGLCDDHVSRDSGIVDGVTGSLNAQQTNLKNYVVSLMKLRDAHPALWNGSRTHIHAGTNVFIDRKDKGNDHILFALNTTNEEVRISVAATAIGSSGDLVDLLSAKTYSNIDGVYHLVLAPFEGAFLDITEVTGAPTVGSDTSTGGDTGTTDPVVVEPADPTALADCARSVAAGDPLGKAMFIRGDYTGGNNFGATPVSRQFVYTGNNIYQVKVTEPANTKYSFKFADAGWTSQFAVENSAPVVLGSAQTMTTAAGAGTQSAISIADAGTYVYSFEINAGKTGGKMMVSKCQ